MTDVIKHMRDRFLAWRLPEDFAPDGGIEFSQRGPHGPTGTNLFTAVQAEAMIRHMLEGAPAASQPEAETVLLEVIEWFHRQPGNYPDWFDRARKAVGQFDGDAGQPEAEPVAWPQGFFRLGGDHRLNSCATEGCFQHVSIRIERGGIGSDHCEPCARAIAAQVATPAPVVPAEGLAAELSLTMSRYDAAAPPDDENGMAAPVMLGPDYVRKIIAALERAEAAEAALAEAEAAAEGALMILVQTQAERDAALARESALLASNQSKRELLYKLTGAQSEVIHMRNRFDTAVATARAEGRKDGLREAAAMCDDTAQEALEESGAESRAIWTWFRGQRDAILAAAEREAQG